MNCDFCSSYLHNYSVHKSEESYTEYTKTISFKIDSFFCNLRIFQFIAKDWVLSFVGKQERFDFWFQYRWAISDE